MEIQASEVGAAPRLARGKLSTFVSCYGTWASDPLLRRRRMRTTRRALSGLTMRSVAESVRGTSTFGSTLRTKLPLSCKRRLHLNRVSNTDQLADVFTKSFRPAQFAAIIARLLRRMWPGWGRDRKGRPRRLLDPIQDLEYCGPYRRSSRSSPDQAPTREAQTGVRRAPMMHQT